MFVRAKRVTAPLDDKVKAQLRGDGLHGYASSGCEHDAQDPSCLSDFARAFYFDSDYTNTDPDHSTPLNTDNDAGDDQYIDNDSSDAVLESIKDLLDPKGNSFRIRLLSSASDAAATLRSSGSGYLLAVMVKLREGGYNAGLCKARWESCGRLTAGSYEYIDVVVSATERYIVDVNFAAEFEVARATEAYERVVAALPRVMVGRVEEVREIVRLVAQASRRSLRSSGLGLPPWRKKTYMLAKWVGPYRRTTVNMVTWTSGAAQGNRDCQGPVSIVGFGAAREPVARAR